MLYAWLWCLMCWYDGCYFDYYNSGEAALDVSHLELAVNNFDILAVAA